MKNAKTRNALALVLNLATFVLVLISILWFFSEEAAGQGIGNMATSGTGCFVFFTNDSNILAALVSLLVVPFNVKSIVSGKDEIPAWVLTLKMIGTAAVTLTMMVVVLFLGPMQGYGLMFTGVCLELHLICPLLAIISFCFFERGLTISKKYLLLTVIPTFIYGTVYLVNVVFTGAWPDFYGFNIGGFWYVSYVVLLAVTYLFALVLRVLHNKSEAVTA